MNWIVLVIAGLFETGWAVGLKYTDGFTRPLPTILCVSICAIRWCGKEAVGILVAA